MSTVNVISVSGSSPNWSLEVANSGGVSAGDRLAAAFEGAERGDGGVYRVANVPDPSHIDVVDDLSVAPFGRPEIGQAYSYTPTTHGMSKLAHRARYWGPSVNLDNDVLEGLFVDVDAQLSLLSSQISALEFSVTALEGSATTIRVSSADTTPGFGEDKIVSGTNVTITKLNPGANEQLEISASGGGGGATQGTVLGTETGPWAVTNGDNLILKTEEGDPVGEFIVNSSKASTYSGQQPTGSGVYTATVPGVTGETFDVSSLVGADLPASIENLVPGDYTTDTWDYMSGNPVFEVVNNTNGKSLVLTGNDVAPPATPATAAQVASWLNDDVLHTNDDIVVNFIDVGSNIQMVITGGADAGPGLYTFQEGISTVASDLGFDTVDQYIPGKVVAEADIEADDPPITATLRAAGINEPGTPSVATAEDIELWLVTTIFTGGPAGLESVTIQRPGPGADTVDLIATSISGALTLTIQCDNTKGLGPIVGWDDTLHAGVIDESGWHFPIENQYSLVTEAGTTPITVPAGYQLVDDIQSLFDAAAGASAVTVADQVLLTSAAEGFDAYMTLTQVAGSGPDNTVEFFSDILAATVYGSGNVNDVNSLTALGLAQGLMDSYIAADRDVNNLGAMHGIIATNEGGKVRLTRQLSGSSRFVQVTGGTLQAMLGFDSLAHAGTD